MALTFRERMIEREVETQWPEWAQDAYAVLLSNGESRVMAHMLVSREGWSLRNSDKAFNEGQRRKMSSMPEKNRDAICAAAQKAGINTNGKYYVGGLGRYTDPTAWVSTADDVLSVCKAKNLTATGVVNYKGHEVPPPKRKGLADDIVARQVGKQLQSDPALAEKVRKGKKSVADVAEQVREKHSFRPT